MPKSRKYEDEAVVRAAMEVFWRHGYRAASMSQLLGATGLSRSSLYEAYGSKRGLFDRAMQLYLRDWIDPLFEPMEAQGAGKESVAGYFLDLANHLATAPRSIGLCGCLIINTALDLDGMDSEAVALVDSYRTRLRKAIFHALSRADEAVQDPDHRAEMLTTTQLGIMVAARVDPRTGAELARAAAAEVRSL